MITKVFSQNIAWNINQVIALSAQAENTKGRARSGYYKAAVIIAASIVEALCFKLLENNKHLKMPLEDYRCKNSQFLSENFISKEGERLSICERSRMVFQLDDRTDFKKTIDISQELKLLPKSLYNKIDKIRVMRNKIHLQGLESIDRSYKKSTVEYISSVIYKLLLMMT
jgi:hypothetical protein